MDQALVEGSEVFRDEVDPVELAVYFEVQILYWPYSEECYYTFL